MPEVPALPTMFLTTATAVALVAAVLMNPLAADAGETPAKLTAKEKSCAELLPLDLPGIRFGAPTYIEPRDTLNEHDELATLAAIQYALSEVGDGQTYVWHHKHGALSAIVKPTSSFRSSKGQICRHIHLLLNSGQYSKKSEGVACRTARGIWSLEG